MYQLESIPQRSKMMNYPEKRKPIRGEKKVKQFQWTFKKIGHSVLNYIKIYFNHSCMHGLKYVLNEDVSWTLKIMWCITLILCHVSCYLIGLQSVARFRYKSTVIGVERDYHYWNSSIPTLTVCPMERLDQTLFNQYCDTHNISDHTMRDELFVFLESLANSTYSNFQDIRAGPRIDEILKQLDVRPKHYMELIYNLTDNYIFGMRRIPLNSNYGTSILTIRQVLTEYGICYMTNSMLGREYSTEYALYGRYPQKNNDGAKNFVKGSYFDREITVYFFGFPEIGTDSYVHSPFEVSAVDKNVGFATEVMRYDVTVVEIITEDNFETDISIAQRKCRFNHESNLTHFPIYTKNLCFQECRLNFVSEKCGCIPHFYPNRVRTPKKVCDYKTLQSCFPKYKSNFLQLFQTNGNKNERIRCDCLDNCEDQIVTLKGKMELKKTKQLTYTIGVQMDVDEWPTERYKRQVVYTFTDLMVSLGSTAGLFLGFSVLSLVELVYFFTIRLFFHNRGIKI